MTAMELYDELELLLDRCTPDKDLDAEETQAVEHATATIRQAQSRLSVQGLEENGQ